MGIGAPSSLGTLLVQRLDAVLGTTLSQQTNVVSGARPDAVSQPADAESAEAGKNELIRHPREAVDRSTAQVEQSTRRTIEKPDGGTRLRAGDNAANTNGTPSAPTRLSFAARTILALLAEFPGQAPPVAGKVLLAEPIAPPPKGATTGATSTSAPGAQVDASQSRGGRTATQAVTAGTEIAGRAVPVAATLAKALASALQTSGLFYESHLADLAFGKRSAQALSAEPQAQLGRATRQAGEQAGEQAGRTGQQARQTGQAGQRLDAPGTQASAGSSPQAGTANTHTVSHSTDSQAATLQHSLANTPTGTAATHTAAANNPLLPAPTHLLVRQQLEVLANQAFVWQGEAWPNTPLRWEVRRDDDARAETNHNDQQRWATRIRINLPRLGVVDARLNLVDSQLLLRLSAPDCADTLESATQTLRHRLGAAGLTVEQISVDASLPESEPSHQEAVDEQS